MDIKNDIIWYDILQRKSSTIKLSNHMGYGLHLKLKFQGSTESKETNR